MTVDNVEPTIRSYRPSDLREVCRVWLASWRSTGVEVAVGASEDELRGRFAHGLDQGWSVTIAELDGSIVGFMAMRPCDGVLDQLFIAPDAQGKGIGSLLLGCARVAMPNGFWLRTAAANKSACRFYEARGLTINRVEPHPVHGHDTVIYLSSSCDLTRCN